MANKIIFGVDLIDVLENKYNMNQLANVPTKYKNGVTTIDFIYGKEKDIDDLKYDKPYIEFSIDDETDGFISGTMYPNGGVEGIQFDSWEDLKYFMKNAKWTESKKYVRKSLKEEIYDIGDYTYPKIVTADNVDKILKSVKDGILDGYRFNCENIDISDLIYSNSFQKYFLNGGKIEWGKVKKSPFNGELVVLGKLIGNNHYDINIALESKENPFGYSKISHFNFFKKFDWIESNKSTRKSMKESKVDFQSVIDKVIPKEYAKNKNAYKYALSCVEGLYNEDEYDSNRAKVYFLNCYISDSFPSWVDELGEEEMDALANALYDGTMKWSDIDSSWLESKKSARKSLKEGINDELIATSSDGETTLYLSDERQANHGKDPHYEFKLGENGYFTRYIRCDDNRCENVVLDWIKEFDLDISKSEISKIIKLHESKKSARKSLKESKASLHEDNVEYGVERIRNKVKGAKVTYYFDDEDCFIDVTEKNGNLWAFTIDFGSDYVYMLEPKEDRGSFGSDNEAFDVIISMLQGKRFNEKKSLKEQFVGKGKGGYKKPRANKSNSGICEDSNGINHKVIFDTRVEDFIVWVDNDNYLMWNIYSDVGLKRNLLESDLDEKLIDEIAELSKQLIFDFDTVF